MELLEELFMQHYPKGAQIKLDSNKGQSVFFLKKGSVKIVNSDNGMVKFVLGAGNIFGELGLCHKPETVTELAYTLEESVVCVFTTEQMKRFMGKHKSLKNAVLKIYGFRLERLERKLEDLVFKDSPTRIEEFIREHIRAFGTLVDGRLKAKKLLSHKDIAHLTNTSRQTVNNVMVRMRREGIIDYDSKFLSMPSSNK